MPLNRNGAATSGGRRLRSTLRVFACLVPALLVAGGAQAAADCNVAVTGVAFGIYDPFATTPDDSTGSVTVTCSNIGNGGGVTRISYSVALSAGSSGSHAQRFMTSGAPRLNYNLYTDPARSLVWGNGSGGSQVVTGSMTVGPGVGNGTRTDTHTIYGRLPALQDAAEGNYLDSIVVTLTF